MEESGCAQPVSVRGMRIESIPFSSLPSQSKLFLDHLSDPVSLKRFYPGAVDSHTAVAGRVNEVLTAYTADRALLCDSLLRINSSAAAGPETLSNIELLRKPDTVAVLTGQQTGLFTGPLYTIYKALSAIKLSRCLMDRGVNAVPVFWMATEDHDFEEISSTVGIDDAGRLAEARFAAAGGGERPVGGLLLDDGVGPAVDELLSALPKTEHSAELRAVLGSAWHAGNTIGRAFAMQLLGHLGRYGLIVADPQDAGLKQLAAPIYAAAAEKGEEIEAALKERARLLEAEGYHAQVLIDEGYFPLFWHDESGRRSPLRLAGEGGLRVKGGNGRLSVDEIKAAAISSPERLSPGVMLRPVVQDAIFPTVCYFGGAAEVAYFAQNSEVYRILCRPATPILHRQSFTVVEAKHARTLEKYGLSFADLFEGEAAVLPGVIDEFIDPASAKLFADVEEKINTELNRLDQALAKLDVTLAANLATRRRKILYHIGAMRKKYYARRAETDETISRRVRGAFTSILPNGVLQERVLNVASFVDRCGPRFFDIMFDAVDLDDRGHRVVHL
jgi:bacillithiol synthase